MIFNKLFNKIYVINLEKSTDRREHIIKEFKRVGITDYDFFKAVNHDSEEVVKIMNSSLVKKFPNCFRCDKKRCACENNVLTPFQIGNWCSFLHIFQDIVEKKHKFVLICEDDIVFSHQYHRILNKLLSPEAFMHYRVNFNAPLLIRMGAAFRHENHNSKSEPMFIKNYALCNPCFAINDVMARFYLEKLKIIDYHSDIYFHEQIPKYYPQVQHFTMFPYPIYELSFVKEKQKFSSTVRPENGIRRIEYKEFLFITTNFLSSIFLDNYMKKSRFYIRKDSIGMSGNINSFLILNEFDKKRFYFEYKFVIFDNIIDEIKIIYSGLNSNKNIFDPYIHKINELLNITFSIDNDNLLKSSIYYYYYYMKMIHLLNPTIIHINNLNEFKKYNIQSSHKIDEYYMMKEKILENIDIKGASEIQKIIDDEKLDFVLFIGN